MSAMPAMVARPRTVKMGVRQLLSRSQQAAQVLDLRSEPVLYHRNRLVTQQSPPAARAYASAAAASPPALAVGKDSTICRQLLIQRVGMIVGALRS